jgi:hypothetical protein
MQAIRSFQEEENYQTRNTGSGEVTGVFLYIYIINMIPHKPQGKI